MSKVALLDGDAWVYRCGFAAEKTHYMVGEHDLQTGGSLYHKFDSYADAMKQFKGREDCTVWSRKEIEPLENCLQMVKSSLENTLNVLGAKQYRLYLSGRRNFRDDIYPDYKANRDGTTRPKYFKDIRDYLLGQWNGHVCDGFEADDALGVDAVQLGSDSILVAVDKDLDQIPGQHYNWTTGEHYAVSPQDGMRFFYEQLLSGDPTDNIPGLKGIGPKKAEAALKDCKTPQECAGLAYSLYRKEVGGVPDAVIDRNASLLWIWRKKEDKHPFWRHLGREPV